MIKNKDNRSFYGDLCQNENFQRWDNLKELCPDGKTKISKEENAVAWWLQELIDRGFVESFCHQPIGINLSESVSLDYIKELKTKSVDAKANLLQSHVYSYDFHVFFNPNAKDIFVNCLTDDKTAFLKYNKNVPFIGYQAGKELNHLIVVRIEVKPNFDQNNMTRLFAINQKWLFQRHKIFVNLVSPFPHKGKGGFFQDVFCPKRYLFQDLNQSKNRKITTWKPRLFDQWAEDMVSLDQQQF